jgi:diadenylate cyclase
MLLDRLISRSRIIDLESNTLKGALTELLAVCKFSAAEKINREQLLSDLLERERTMTSYLGDGVGLPHLRVNMKRRYLIAVGRCREGLVHEGINEYPKARIVILLLAAESARSYLNLLATIAQTFHEKEVIDRLATSPDLESFRTELKKVLAGEDSHGEKRSVRLNRQILKEAQRLSRAAKCTSVMVFCDTFAGGMELTQSFKPLQTVLIAPSITEHSSRTSVADAILPVRAFTQSRLSQMRSAILIGLSRNVFKPTDLICCVGGIPKSNQLDAIVIVNIGREFSALASKKDFFIPASVEPEVMERVLAIATELASEGREGKPVGSLFVLGDTKMVMQYSKPLILNPFYGYKEEDRNVLNPFMDETVKELSSIDGAFIIRGNGVLEAAGTLLHAPEIPDQLPPGLGARHAAAAAITKSTQCIAIVVSSSTGQVTLFSQGSMLPLYEKPIGGNI